MDITYKQFEKIDRIFFKCLSVNFVAVVQLVTHSAHLTEEFQDCLAILAEPTSSRWKYLRYLPYFD